MTEAKSKITVRYMEIEDTEWGNWKKGFTENSNRPWGFIELRVGDYFSATFDGGSAFGGCMHDLILAVRPDLKPFVDLHLSSIDGIPMHALANGEHWLSGILSEVLPLPLYRYRPTFGLSGRPANHTPERCFAIMMEHFRLDRESADLLVAKARLVVSAAESTEEIREDLHSFLAIEVEAMKPRWVEEAAKAMAVFDKTLAVI